MNEKAQGPSPGKREAQSRVTGSAQDRREYTTAIQSVYDGEACLGHIYSRGREGYEAFNAADRSLGLFPTSHAAATAIFQGGE